MGARGGYSLEMGCALRRQGDILIMRTGGREMEALRKDRLDLGSPVRFQLQDTRSHEKAHEKGCCKRPGSSRPPTPDDEGEFELRTLPSLQRAA